MSKYTVIVVNRSSQQGCFYLFQKNPEQLEDPNFYSLVWRCALTTPNTQVTFHWEDFYEFFWRDVQDEDTLTEGSRLIGIPPANAVSLTCRSGAFSFEDSSRIVSAGSAAVFTDSTIPVSGLETGLGMGGVATVVRCATPNFTFLLPLRTEYWLGFADSSMNRPGRPIPLEALNLSLGATCQLVFPPAVTQLKAEFCKDNTWFFSPA